ncbi:MAG: hypothetical protein HeimC3_49800 [Candidatus Heimdallarchaeota archaeon LC_3]|nr:MAG: hypothetical protein HeimC3_49800 [Candidatus Heimdallarchaeota archaeon LC_3]
MIEINTDIRKLVIEIIASLANLKRNMVSFVLEPSKVPPSCFREIFHIKDSETGRNLSKREMAPLILDKIEKLSNKEEIILNIITIASKWEKFHLHPEEYRAKATVETAKAMLNKLERMKKETSKKDKRDIERIEKERLTRISKELKLLLRMFDDMHQMEENIKRGFLLEDLLNRLLKIFEIKNYRSFKRNENGEQIDGAFVLNGWYYLVECRWRQKMSDRSELDSLSQKILRSGKQTMGVFLSINGWSENVVPLLKQNPNKDIILLDGYELRTVLNGSNSFEELMTKKLDNLNLKSEPY